MTGVNSAIAAGYDQIAEFLLESGASVDDSAIRTAINKGHIELLTRMLDLTSEASVEIEIDHLVAVIKLGDASIIEKIITHCHLSLSSGMVGRKKNTTKLRMSLWALNPEAVAVETLWPMIQNAVGDPDTFYDCQMELFTWIIEKSDTAMVRFFFELVAGSDWEECLELAVRSRKLEVVKAIIQACEEKHKSCKRWFGHRALNLAVEELDKEAVHLLLSFGVDSRTYLEEVEHYETITHSAFATAIAVDESERLHILSLIVEKVPDMNCIVIRRGGRHQTSLVAAIEAKNFPAVKLLIESGADPCLLATRQTQRNPLQAACAVGNLEVVQYLLQLGADVNSPAFEINGATALQFAAISGHLGIAKLLLQCGADVNAPCARVNGRTALEGAAEHGRVDMIKFLLENGARIDGDGTKQYERALKFARRNNHIRATCILEMAVWRQGAFRKCLS